MNCFHVTGENHQSKCVSFRAQTRNPVCLCASVPLCLCAFPLCHSWPRPGIQSASVPLCLCAFPPFVPLCLSLVSFRAQTRNPACLCASVPLCLSLVSFRAQTRNPFCLCAFVPLCLSLVSFLAQTRNPVCLCAFVPSPCVLPPFVPLCLCAFPLCHSGPRPGIQGIYGLTLNCTSRLISGYDCF